MRNLNTLLCAACLALAACGASQDEKMIEAAKAQIRATLKDPDSAQFRNVRWVSKDSMKLLCGEVNAKNSYGGYVGFRDFWALPPGWQETGKEDPSFTFNINMATNVNC